MSHSSGSIRSALLEYAGSETHDEIEAKGRDKLAVVVTNARACLTFLYVLEKTEQTYEVQRIDRERCPKRLATCGAGDQTVFGDENARTSARIGGLEQPYSTGT